MVPANKKWFRNLVIARTIADTLEAMGPEFPAAEQGLDKIVVPSRRRHSSPSRRYGDRVHIDHVIYATRDLDGASAMIEEQLGIPVVAGGRHEGLGTHNRIVPLGGGYLELLAVCDEEEAARSALGSALQARIEESGDGLMGWAVAVDDVRPVAARLDTWVTTIARQGLTAQLTGLLESMRDPFLPFFVARDPGVPDPGRDGAAGGITWIELVGDGERLAQWIDGAELPVRITEGPPAVVAVGIGDRELRPR